jgi:hypothetical protein
MGNMDSHQPITLSSPTMLLQPPPCRSLRGSQKRSHNRRPRAQPAVPCEAQPRLWRESWATGRPPPRVQHIGLRHPLREGPHLRPKSRTTNRRHLHLRIYRLDLALSLRRSHHRHSHRPAASGHHLRTIERRSRSTPARWTTIACAHRAVSACITSARWSP